MKNVIITIARQYGSGGRTIGMMLSKELGIPFYDRAIIRYASEDSGIHEALFGRVDETLKLSIRDRLKKKTYDETLIPPESKDFISDDNLFNYQAKIMKKLADEGPCIIIGRCADYVLRDRDDVLRLFIYADEDFCYEAAKDKHSMTERELRSYIKKVDKHRGDFYRYYTGHEWNDARNYDLCINTSVTGFEKCVEMVKAYIDIRWSQE